MLQNIDLYLGAFLIISGILIGLINVRRVIYKKNRFSKVLLSENIVLSSIGIAFIIRAIYSGYTETVQINNINMYRLAMGFEDKGPRHCSFLSLLISYGPLIISMVNSFLSLIIDNYMHYQMIVDGQENDIEEVNNSGRSHRIYHSILKYINEHRTLVTIIIQWMVPIVILMFMLPIQVTEVSLDEARQLDSTCMTMFNMNHEKCLEQFNLNVTSFPVKLYEGFVTKTNSSELDAILENVLGIIKNHSTNTDFSYTPTDTSRRPKTIDMCYRLCITDNKMIVIYMFVLAFMSYFVPIIISSVILTRISSMRVKMPHMKSHVTREFLYNVVFWSPVMFDTFVSLILCSYSMTGMRTSFFNVMANIYQAVRNVMNTKYFKENTVAPI